jgi:prepilin-type N-terminal cleavage/methylation domain-containing protein
MKSSRHLHGFTLIEMLAATTLTAIAMVVVLRVIAGIGQSRSALARQEHRNPWPDSMLQLVRWDIAHAQKMYPTPDGFALEGFGGLDPATRAPDGQPVNIRYAIVPAGGRRWLVRRQTPLNASAGEEAWSEMICADVQSVQLEPADESENAKGNADSSDAVPDTVRLRIRSTNAEASLVDQVICVR